MNITIFGNVCIDQNESEHSSYQGAGGPPTFMYKILSQFSGVNLSVIAPYGNDFLPYKNDLPLVNQPVGEKTLRYSNITKNGTRTQYAFNIESAMFAENTHVESTSKSDVVVICPLHPFVSVQQIQTLVQEKSVPVILLPQGYFRAFTHENKVIPREFIEQSEILPLVHFVIMSDQDHPDSMSLAKRWADEYEITVIVTRGEKGASVFKKEDVIDVPTEIVDETDIVDSVGSGDIFSISFAYYFVRSRDIEKSVIFANAIARQCLFYDAGSLRIDREAAEKELS
jgi:sugar/nucleoside kinase (ribokinase family)